MPTGVYKRKPVPLEIKLQRQKEHKEYLKKWYAENKIRRIKAASDWYYNHKEYKLEYLKARRPRDNKLKRLRYQIPEKREKILSRDSLYRHTRFMAVREWAKKEIKRTHDIYMNYQEETNSIAKKKWQIWTAADLKYLYDNYQDKTIFQLAQTLGRTWAAVSRKMNLLGLKKVEWRLPELLKR